MGIGTEVFCAVCLGRKGIGVELKESYYKQAVKNMAESKRSVPEETLFAAGSGE